MSAQPTSLPEYIEAIRRELVCHRCGKYIGSLAEQQYLPPAYPIALDQIPAEREAEALIAFEWHMVQRQRNGNFRIAHPSIDGRCVSMREWLADGEDEDEGLPAGADGEVLEA
ncbi:MAG: hypothetical protein HYX50_01625 [Chloroflexi bacterium]|nr:hypothetical protein [Chloroflexota bacterium]